MATLDLVVQNDDELLGIPDDADFLRWADAALQAADAALELEEPYELTIRIVSQDESRQLNRDYRGKDYATNVLSFPFEAPPDVDVAILGDLAICDDVVRKEAEEQHKEVAAHWAHMVIHGTLHLLGYDHIEDDDAENMEALEIRVLAGFGIPDPYGDS